MEQIQRWTKVEPYTGEPNRGCMRCPMPKKLLDMRKIIAVGFGDAQVRRDGEVVYSEAALQGNMRKIWSVRKAENMAAKDPDHDWRIAFYAPLHEEEYQRHGPKEWVMISSGEGFA